MIAPEHVEETLRPWLGSGFLARNKPLCDRTAFALFSFQPKRDSLFRLAEWLDNLLFMSVREDTHGRMALEMDTGKLIRLRVGDFSLMADELLYLLFEALPRDAAIQAIIREYSMHSGSLSALRALYLLFGKLQTEEETETLRRVITSCHEPWRFRPWID
jgi:hypothetical protein